MKVAKEFKFEAAHRLPLDDGDCKNLHGHSYRVIVELEGDTDNDGMVVDFRAIKTCVQPIIDELDHAAILWHGDGLVRQLDSLLGLKVVRLAGYPTVENICNHIAERIDLGAGVTVRVHETATCYAEVSL